MNSANGALRQQSVPQAPAIPAGRLLLIEDDEHVAWMIDDHLSMSGYQVTHCSTGLEGLAAAESGDFDLIITDRMLPELDGLSVVARVRQFDIRVPILLLSAMRSLDDRVGGLSAGGDDYLTKPFELAELSARVAALMRRTSVLRESVLRVGPLVLDLIDRSVRRGDRAIELLPREFKLLEYLMRHAGRPVTRANLLQEVWHYRFLPQTNLVDVHVGRLRRKIDGPDEKPLIESIRGTGFILRDPG